METLAHMATIICTFLKATLKPEQHFQVWGQHVLLSRWLLMEGFAYFSKIIPKNILHVLQQHGSGVTESRCKLGLHAVSDLSSMYCIMKKSILQNMPQVSKQQEWEMQAKHQRAVKLFI